MNEFKGLNQRMGNEKLEAIIEALESDTVTSIKELNVRVNNLLNGYFEAYGNYPKSAYLTRLANVLLRDDIRDRDRLKVSKKEYPFLSSTQLRFREKRERPIETDKIDFFLNKYTYNAGSAYKKRTKEIDE